MCIRLAAQFLQEICTAITKHDAKRRRRRRNKTIVSIKAENVMHTPQNQMVQAITYIAFNIFRSGIVVVDGFSFLRCLLSAVFCLFPLHLWRRWCSSFSWSLYHIMPQWILKTLVFCVHCALALLQYSANTASELNSMGYALPLSLSHCPLSRSFIAFAHSFCVCAANTGKKADCTASAQLL